MSYENAPATQMLATHCFRCGRDLVDATSVQIGIGPECRKLCGYGEGPEASREEANKIIHILGGLAQKPRKTEGRTETILEACKALRSLGFNKVAVAAEAALSTVQVLRKADDPALLDVVTPYSPAAVAAIRGIPGRRWDKERKVNTVPVTAGEKLFEVLKSVFPGHLVASSKGLVVLA